MTDHMFGWTQFALGHGTRLLTILVVAFVLNLVLRGLTRRLVNPADAEATGRVARMREQQTRTLAGVLYSGGVAVIVIVSVLTGAAGVRFQRDPCRGGGGTGRASRSASARSILCATSSTDSSPSSKTNTSLETPCASATPWAASNI